MIYKKWDNENKLFDYILCIVFSLVLMLFINVLSISATKNNLQKNISQAYYSSLVVEVLNEDDSITKGTAFLYEKEYAISVAHLFIDNYKKIFTYFYDKKKCMSAEVCVIDKDKDIAILKVQNTRKVSSVRFAKQNDISFGNEIFKIGNALGYGLSVDEGVISAPYVKLNVGGVEKELINISIPINSGDSGGAVFNMNKQFVGLISFKTSPGASNTDSLSFIVPSYIIKAFIDEYKNS